MGIIRRMRLLAAVGTLSAFAGVALGAFAAHYLQDSYESSVLEVFDTGVRYQMYHSLAMILSALLIAHLGRPAETAGWIFLAGILLFSGSLYGLTLLGIRWLGMVTPIGGTLFLVGWLFLAWSALRS